MTQQVTGFRIQTSSGSSAVVPFARPDVQAMAAIGLEQATGYTHHDIKIDHVLNDNIWDVTGTDNFGNTHTARITVEFQYS